MKSSSIARAEYVNKLTKVFRTVGYSRASLTELGGATGLQRSSLYHYFPGGKMQMLQEVLDESDTHFQEMVLLPLRSDAPPRERFTQLIENLSLYYDSGRESCILGVLSADIATTDIKDRVRDGFNQWVTALSQLFEKHGMSKKTSQDRAYEIVAAVQGGLILAHAMEDGKVFCTILEKLEETVFR